MTVHRISGSQNSFEIIQQWQYTGPVASGLLTDNAFNHCKKFGITSLQSYVTWAEIEKKPGRLHYAIYDALVDKILKHNLKWVPFLILGPHYATPKWFQESEHNLYAKCLEHGRPSKIQSIWNPHLPQYVAHFLSRFAEHYKDHSFFESIALGISGNWGEAIYPATGGFFGGFHSHPGWWCGDDYAIENFRQFAAKKYGAVSTLNQFWRTNFNDFSNVSFPPIERSIPKDLFYQLIKMIPNRLKPAFARAWSAWKRAAAPLIHPARHSLRKAQTNSPIQKLQHWVDLTEWYQKSMTDWAEFWIKTARKNFPNNNIYLVTGGAGMPILGADFAAQTKMASKYRTGIRITNQNDDYRESFILTRLVASASRNYGTYFTTEEAGVNRSHGVTMRIFDAATSAANGVYFKSIIGSDSGLCGGRNLPPGEPTKGAKNLSENLRYVSSEHPIIDAAVLFPNTTIAIKPSVLNSLYCQGGKLRAFVDFDLVDENMIGDNLLKNYRFLVLLEGGWVRSQTMKELKAWITNGGILISGSHLFLTSIETETENSDVLFDNKGIYKKISQGFSVCIRPRKGRYLRRVSEALTNLNREYPWNGITPVPDFLCGKYVTRFSGRLMSYDPKKFHIQIHKIKTN